MQELPITPRQMAELMKLAQTGPGKQLLNLLKREKGPELQRALSRSDYETAKAIVGDFMQRPDVKELLQQLGKL